MPIPQWILPTILPNVGGVVGSLVTRSQIETWYKGLKKPWFNPPPYVFGPTWTALYSGMGYASYLVWKNGGGFNGAARTPLMLYGAQLAMNWIWTPLFFGMHRVDLALADIVALTGTAAVCAVKFHEIDSTAGYIMLPYLAWLSFASLLTYCIWRDNKPAGEKTEKSL